MGFQKSINNSCARIMLAALKDKHIMPVHRYRQVHRAFSVYISKHAQCEGVQEYKRLRAMREYVWRCSVTDVLEACEAVFFRAGIVARPDEYMKRRRFSEVLQDVHIGCQCIGGVQEGEWEED